MHLTPGHPCGSQGLSQEVFYDAVGAILLACAAFQDLRERGTLVRLAVRNPLFYPRCLRPVAGTPTPRSVACAPVRDLASNNSRCRRQPRSSGLIGASSLARSHSRKKHFWKQVQDGSDRYFLQNSFWKATIQGQIREANRSFLGCRSFVRAQNAGVRPRRFGRPDRRCVKAID